jgi:hypothetical protein
MGTALITMQIIASNPNQAVRAVWSHLEPNSWNNLNLCDVAMMGRAETESSINIADLIFKAIKQIRVLSPFGVLV